MKVAIYIAEGVTQLVLTSENDWEKNVTKSVTQGSSQVDIRSGGFYECRGGFIREDPEEQSLILVVGIKAEEIKP